MSDSEAVSYARLLRPYDINRLDLALFHVEATAGSVRSRKLNMFLKPPPDAPGWQFELEQIRNDLLVLAEEYVPLAVSRLDALIRSAPADYQRAVDAMHKVLLGINAEWQSSEAAS